MALLVLRGGFNPATLLGGSGIGSRARDFGLLGDGPGSPAGVTRIPSVALDVTLIPSPVFDVTLIPSPLAVVTLIPSLSSFLMSELFVFKEDAIEEVREAASQLFLWAREGADGGVDDREALLDSAPLPLVVLIEVGIVEGSAEEETVVEAEKNFFHLKSKKTAMK